MQDLAGYRDLVLVGPRIVFAHVPKTGGTWVCRVLEALGEGKRVAWKEGGAHEEIDEGDLSSGKPVLGSQHAAVRDLDASVLASRHLAVSVRDPWSWYVSYYFYSLTPADTDVQHRGAIEGFCPPGVVSSFQNALPGMLGIVDSRPTLFYGTNAVEDLGSELRSRNIGLCSYYLQWMLEGRAWSRGFSILRTSCLSDDLLRTLRSAGRSLSWSEEEMVRAFPRAIVGQESHELKKLYGKKLWKLVEERDSLVLKMLKTAGSPHQGWTS